MRVLLDANIFISYLLTPQANGTISTIVDAAFYLKYELLVPEELLEEFVLKVKKKKYLASRVTIEDLEDTVEAVLAVAEVIPKITEEITAVSRDAKDNYLLAYGLVGNARYLVTGDEDLLVLRSINGMTIIHPKDFVKLVVKA